MTLNPDTLLNVLEAMRQLVGPEDTLEAIRAQDAPENFPFEDLEMDCDWEESDCPTCGRPQDEHDQRTMTRCVGAWF